MRCLSISVDPEKPKQRTRTLRDRDVPRRRRWRSREQKPRFLIAARWAGQDARIQRFISERNRESSEETAARAILRREDADAAAATDQIYLVQQVDDVEAQLQRSRRIVDVEFMSQPEVDLGIARRVIAVRNGEAARQSEVLPQPGAEDRIDAGACLLPS